MGKITQIKNAKTNSWADTSIRFAVDVLLRAEGFHLVRRDGKKEAIWGLGNAEFTQTEALRWLHPEEVEDAKWLASIYYEGYV